MNVKFVFMKFENSEIPQERLIETNTRRLKVSNLVNSIRKLLKTEEFPDIWIPGENDVKLPEGHSNFVIRAENCKNGSYIKASEVQQLMERRVDDVFSFKK